MVNIVQCTMFTISEIYHGITVINMSVSKSFLWPSPKVLIDWPLESALFKLKKSFQKWPDIHSTETISQQNPKTAILSEYFKTKSVVYFQFYALLVPWGLGGLGFQPIITLGRRPSLQHSEDILMKNKFCLVWSFHLPPLFYLYSPHHENQGCAEHFPAVQCEDAKCAPLGGAGRASLMKTLHLKFCQSSSLLILLLRHAQASGCCAGQWLLLW